MKAKAAVMSLCVERSELLRRVRRSLEAASASSACFCSSSRASELIVKGAIDAAEVSRVRGTTSDGGGEYCPLLWLTRGERTGEREEDFLGLGLLTPWLED